MPKIVFYKYGNKEYRLATLAKFWNVGTDRAHAWVHDREFVDYLASIDKNPGTALDKWRQQVDDLLTKMIILNDLLLEHRLSLHMSRWLFEQGLTPRVRFFSDRIKKINVVTGQRYNIKLFKRDVKLVGLVSEKLKNEFKLDIEEIMNDH